jgi:hypothetical protein
MRIGLVGTQKPFIGRLQKVLADYGIETVSLNPASGLTRWQRTRQILAQINLCDVVYATSGGVHWRWWMMTKALGKRTVNHWIGTDTLDVVSSRVQRMRARIAENFIDLHVIIATHLRDELQQSGLKLRRYEIVPVLPLPNMPHIDTMPDSHAVLAYCPEARAEFYGSEAIASLAARFPEYPFIIVGNRGQGMPNLKNLEFRGLVDAEGMKTVYEQSTVLVRMLRHDSGMAAMVVEAMTCGRQVIYKYPVPYCRQASTVEQAAEHLTDILQSSPQYNLEAANYARCHFSYKAIADQIVNILVK